MYYNIESGAFETGSVESETKKEAVISLLAGETDQKLEAKVLTSQAQFPDNLIV